MLFGMQPPKGGVGIYTLTYIYTYKYILIYYT